MDIADVYSVYILCYLWVTKSIFFPLSIHPVSLCSTYTYTDTHTHTRIKFDAWQSLNLLFLLFFFYFFAAVTWLLKSASINFFFSSPPFTSSTLLLLFPSSSLSIAFDSVFSFFIFNLSMKLLHLFKVVVVVKSKSLLYSVLLLL